MDESLNLGKAEDERLNKLLRTVEGEMSAYAKVITKQIDHLAQVGIAICAEHDINKLLDIIVDETRRFTHADGGTLYLLENEKLVFHILQNETLKIRKGGTGDKVELPPVALVKSNVSAYVALTKESVHIPDVYEAQGFDFTGPRKYDQETGYRSKSMLVVPMVTLQGEVIGVLQLLNAKDPGTGEVIPFSDNFIVLVRSMASQAAVSITNARLLSRLAHIGIALSAEHDINKLLEMIVDEARHFTDADAGTLYLIENEKLVFRILQNDTLKIRKGGTGDKVELPPVALVKTNVSAYVALTQESVNIADVYEAQGFDFTGPRKYDLATGYRSKSMLVVPLMNLDGEVIGVLQLLNAKAYDTGEVIPFADHFVALTRSMASQAAVSITNAKLIADMEHLFEAFVSVITTAIDERSPYTAGHIRRVAELGALMCEVINKTTEGKYADVHFNSEQVKEMLMAGWLHDVGKITTPVHVVDKGTKLETIFDRIDILRHRFELIDACARNEMLEKKLAALGNGGGPAAIAALDEQLEAFRAKHWDDFEFITRSNKGGEFMADPLVARIKEIGARTYRYNGADHRYLTENEIDNLNIRKGTLTDDERKIIQDHVVLTMRMLEKIPFTKKLSKIPFYAGTHHETLDGKGYPAGLKGDEIPLEGRILALVDIYEALTASDRPYKKAMPVEKAFAILKAEADHGKLDKDLLELFMKANVHGIYRNMHPEFAEGHKTIDNSDRLPGSTTAMAMDMIRRVLGTNMPDNIG